MFNHSHDGRDRHTGRYKSTIRCDYCGAGVGNNAYYSDDEVCDGSDGPGFFLCGRKRCIAARDQLPIEVRRVLYTAQRALIDGDPVPQVPLRVHGVLAAAYPGGKRSNPKATLTHAAVGDDLTAICGLVRPDMLCDVEVEGAPSCKVCAEHVARLTIFTATK